MMRLFAALIASLTPLLAQSSQSFESVPLEAKVSGFIGKGTYEIVAERMVEPPYQFAKFSVSINSQALAFPESLWVAVKRPWITNIGITYSGAKDRYKVVIPYFGEGGCADEAANTIEPAVGRYSYRFRGDLTYLSFTNQLPEDSCPEGMFYEEIE